MAKYESFRFRKQHTTHRILLIRIGLHDPSGVALKRLISRSTLIRPRVPLWQRTDRQSVLLQPSQWAHWSSLRSITGTYRATASSDRWRYRYIESRTADQRVDVQAALEMQNSTLDHDHRLHSSWRKLRHQRVHVATWSAVDLAKLCLVPVVCWLMQCSEHFFSERRWHHDSRRESFLVTVL